ncbi:TPA: hypothetical protein ACE7HI_002007, partial [Neisseria gonorrhoeae]
DSRLRGNDEVEVTRNLKQAKPNEPDSHFRGNDGVLGFCFWFSVFEGMTVQLLRIYPAQSLIHYLATCLTIRPPLYKMPKFFQAAFWGCLCGICR